MGKSKHREGHHRGGKWNFSGKVRQREQQEAAGRAFDEFEDVNAACCAWLRDHDRWWNRKWRMEYGRDVAAER